MNIAIIGAGISGLMSAWYLSAYQGNRITLFDKQFAAKESSWAGGGILSPLNPWRYGDAVSRLASFSQRLYEDLCASLYQLSNIDPQYRKSGLLILAKTQEFAQAKAWAEQWKVKMQFVDHEKLGALEPELNTNRQYAFWLPEVAQVRNPRLMKSLITGLEKRNVTVKEHTTVKIALTHNQAWIKSPVSGAFDLIVVTAGAWTPDLFANFDYKPQIEPVHGQMLLFKTKSVLIKRITLQENRYAIPRIDGRVLFGSTMDYRGYDKSTTTDARAALLQSAIDLFPVLGDSPIERQWAGLRPGTPDGVPYICQHPQAENLFINAGHFRNGVVLAPASAILLSQLIMGQKTFINPDPYSFTKK